jgi:hypothetical protein
VLYGKNISRRGFGADIPKLDARVYGHGAFSPQMDTDMIMGICAAVGMTICGVCVVVNAWRSTPHPHMKISRSDPDLSILENAIPSASAYRLQPPDTASTSSDPA